MNLTIIGGGSSAHVLISLLSKTNFRINVLTRNPKQWKKKIKTSYILPDESIEFECDGYIDNVSDNPQDLIPEADIIILCMPVHKYKEALNNIAPYLSKVNTVYIGTVYGQGGFNWMVDDIIERYSLFNISYFAFGLIPWICRTNVYGQSGFTYGCKVNNVVSVKPKKNFDYLNEILFNKICYDWFGVGEFHLAENFISLTLSVDNQIIHPSRMYSLYLESKHGWENEESVPYFYRDYNIQSAHILENLDNDYSKVREKLIELYPNKNFDYMLNYMDLEHFSYESKSINIVDSFVNSSTLTLISTPVTKENDGRYHLNKTHRFFFDDIFYGLCIVKWFAEELSITVETVDNILYWAQEMLNISIINDNKLNLSNLDKSLLGIPTVYGFDSFDNLLN